MKNQNTSQYQKRNSSINNQKSQLSSNGRQPSINVGQTKNNTSKLMYSSISKTETSIKTQETKTETIIIQNNQRQQIQEQKQLKQQQQQAQIPSGQKIEEESKWKDLMALFFFSINFLMFLIIGIIGFAKDDSEEIEKMDKLYEQKNLGTFSDLKDSPPSVIAAFFVTVAVGIFWLFLFVQYFNCVLIFLIYWKCFLFLILAIVFITSESIFIPLGIIFFICFLITCSGAYVLGQKTQILKLIGNLSKRYGNEKKEIFLIQLFSALLLLVLTLYFIYGYTGLMSVTREVHGNTTYIIYDLDPNYRNLGIFYIFTYAWTVFCVIHHFKYCLSNSIQNWFNKKEQKNKDNLKDSMYHFGSICFSSGFYLLFEIYDFFMSCINTYFWCLSIFLASCRFYLKKFLSCFVIVEIGRKNTNYLSACSSVTEYVQDQTLEFLVFTWAGDTVSDIISACSFWSGIIIGIVVLVTTSNSFSFLFVAMTIIIMIIVGSVVSSLYSSATEIILYTFAMCIHDANKKKDEQPVVQQLAQYHEVVQIIYVEIQTKITSGLITLEKLGVKQPESTDNAKVAPQQEMNA